MKTLFTFRHGLGDAVQLSIVLKHLAIEYPDWEITVEALQNRAAGLKGIRACSIGHPMPWRDQKYDEKHNLKFLCPTNVYKGVPTTKAVKCLLEEFGLFPRPDLFRYEWDAGTIHPELERWIEENKPYGLIHWRGNSSPNKKNLTDEEVIELAQILSSRGIKPVLMDWYKLGNWASQYWLPPLELCSHPNQMWHLINGAEILYGIDSGPEHLAATTKTPTLVFWYFNHPLDCIDAADNLHHFVAGSSVKQIMKTPKASGLEFFGENYHFTDCEWRGEQIKEVVEQYLEAHPL